MPSACYLTFDLFIKLPTRINDRHNYTKNRDNICINYLKRKFSKIFLHRSVKQKRK